MKGFTEIITTILGVVVILFAMFLYGMTIFKEIEVPFMHIAGIAFFGVYLIWFKGDAAKAIVQKMAEKIRPGKAVGLILILFASSVLFTSCLTDRKIANNCHRFADVCGTPEKEIVYRDTSLHIDVKKNIALPKDSVSADIPYSLIDGDLLIGDTDLVLLDNPQIRIIDNDEISVKGNYVKTDIKFSDGKMTVRSYIYKDSIPVHIDMYVTLENAIKEEKEVRIVPKKYIPKFYLYSGIIMIALMIVSLFTILHKLNIFSVPGLLKRLFGWR